VAQVLPQFSAASTPEDFWVHSIFKVFDYFFDPVSLIFAAYFLKMGQWRREKGGCQGDESLATHLKHASIDAEWHLLWGFAGGEVGVLGAEEREVGDWGPGGERGQRMMSTGEGAKN